MIKEIIDAVTIPVMAKVRIGHFVEAQVCFFTHALSFFLSRYLGLIPRNGFLSSHL